MHFPYNKINFYLGNPDVLNKKKKKDNDVIIQYGCFQSFPFREDFVIFVRQIT